jgi:hypothetical protein
MISTIVKRKLDNCRKNKTYSTYLPDEPKIKGYTFIIQESYCKFAVVNPERRVTPEWLWIQK